ncbi:nucleolin 1-like [Salvia splendens]|uniref:nucleolin 1-like n=1 Tax=Salvia splendens TaxID=180675 RepID=UPI001C2654C8|nr:nucleolin 1-like [Salvia splendens]
MDLASLEKGKRAAEDAIEAELVSAKKQKVAENVAEITTDTIEIQKKVDTSSLADDCCSKPEHCIEGKVSGVDLHIVSVLEEKINFLEEDTVAAEEGHIAAAVEIDEPNYDVDSCFRGETNLSEDVPAAISLSENDPTAPQKKREESSKDFVVSYEDAASLNGDVTTGNLSSLPPSTVESLVSVEEKDDSRIYEFDSAHETDNDDNVDTAQEEDITNEELELDDETSSSDDDLQTPTTPTEQTSGGKTLYVGNLSFSVEQEDVENFFKDAGEVVQIRFAMNFDETFKGYGYVEFASAEAAEKALCELNGKELLRRRVRLDFLKERGSFTRYNGCQGTESFPKEGNAQGRTVFVRGFSKSKCQPEIMKSLEEHFSSCGEVSKVSVPKDQDGCARGIAYIEFKERDAFIRALALHGSEFKEGIMSVIEARPRGDSHNSVGSSRCCESERIGGRHGWNNFGGRSGLQDFRGRSGIRETGAWSGAGFGGQLNGRGASSHSSGRGVWEHSNGRHATRGSNGRGPSCESSVGGVWGDSNGRGAWGNSRVFNGRGAPCNTGGRRRDWVVFNGRGWGNSSGRGGWGNSSGGGAWADSSAMGASHNSSGRGAWRDSSDRGVWSNSSPIGASRNSSGGGAWGNSSDRGVWGNSNATGASRSSSERGAWGDSCGRGVWGNSTARGALRGSSGRGSWWGGSSDRGASPGSSGRGSWWGGSSDRGASPGSSGRGSWWGGSSDRGASCGSSGRGFWGGSSERGASRSSSGRGLWDGSSDRGASRGSSGRGVWGNSSGRSGGWSNSRGRGDWGASSGRSGGWSNSRGRGVWPESSGRGILGSYTGGKEVGGSGVCIGGGGGGQETLTDPSIASPEAPIGNNTSLNNEGEVGDQMIN